MLVNASWKIRMSRGLCTCLKFILMFYLLKLYQNLLRHTHTVSMGNYTFAQTFHDPFCNSSQSDLFKSFLEVPHSLFKVFRYKAGCENTTTGMQEGEKRVYHSSSHKLMFQETRWIQLCHFWHCMCAHTWGINHLNCPPTNNFSTREGHFHAKRDKILNGGGGKNVFMGRFLLGEVACRKAITCSKS